MGEHPSTETIALRIPASLMLRTLAYQPNVLPMTVEYLGTRAPASWECDRPDQVDGIAQYFNRLCQSGERDGSTKANIYHIGVRKNRLYVTVRDYALLICPKGLFSETDPDFQIITEETIQSVIDMLAEHEYSPALSSGTIQHRRKKENEGQK